MRFLFILLFILFGVGCSNVQYKGKKGDASFYHSEDQLPMQYSSTLEFAELDLNEKISQTYLVRDINAIDALQLRAYLKSGAYRHDDDASDNPIKRAREEYSGCKIKFTVKGPQDEILGSSTLDMGKSQLWLVSDSSEGLFAWDLIANLLNPPDSFIIQVDVLSIAGSEPPLWLIIKGHGTERGAVGN